MLVIRTYCGADALMEAVRMSMLCKRCLLFLEAVRMGKARHVCFVGRSGWGWPRWQCVSYVTVRCVPRVSEGGVPTILRYQITNFLINIPTKFIYCHNSNVYWVITIAYKSSFQVSGTPARHQWLQSLIWPPLYIDGCPSFLSCDNIVISSNDTTFDILLRTSFTTPTAGGKAPGYVEPFIGSVCPLHVANFSFHSSPLFHQQNKIICREINWKINMIWICLYICIWNFSS